jgi:Predicted membrane protein
MFTKTISDMFFLSLPILEKIFRPLIVYVFLVIGLRIAGKRELAQLNPFDLVVLLTLSNTVQNAIIGDDTSITGGLIGATTLFIVNYLVVRFLYNHKKIDEMVEGKEDVLIDNGIIRKDNLGKEIMTLPELEMAAHRQGFGTLGEIDRAVIEPGGAITFIGKRPDPEVGRHQELLARLDQITKELAELKSSQIGTNTEIADSAA